jgi:hypothetical protein
LPVVLYGCETWSLALKEEHRLRVFENRVLRRVFGANGDVVTGEWSECVYKIILNSKKLEFFGHFRRRIYCHSHFKRQIPSSVSEGIVNTAPLPFI